MKLKKAAKFLSMAVVTVVFAAFTMGAGACAPSAEAQAIVTAANTQITVTVNAAQVVGNVLLAVGFSSDSAVVQTLCNNVENTTSQIEAQAASQLTRMGVTYTTEAYYVTIAGNQVLIDPLKAF